jgi:hypothetical protein
MTEPTERVIQMAGHTTFDAFMGHNVAEESDLDLIRKKYKGGV